MQLGKCNIVNMVSSKTLLLTLFAMLFYENLFLFFSKKKVSFWLLLTSLILAYVTMHYASDETTPPTSSFSFIYLLLGPRNPNFEGTKL